MFLTPARFQDFLSRCNHIDEIYNALHDDDLGSVVISALEVLKKTHQLPQFQKQLKDTKLSTQTRKKGNIAFERDNSMLALMCYNQALLLAPKDSKELKLAISNRSAVFQKMKAYKACIKDIDICFSMGCPSDIVDKLKKRRKEVEHLAAQEEQHTCYLASIFRKYTEHAFNNSDIPCASSEINATSSDIPTVVASKDIKIGSVLTTETAYVSHTNPGFYLFNCHYCQKSSLNLIPCEDCNCTMFCDDECRNKCLKEYHKYECLIMHVIREICNGPLPNLMIKAALKLRQNCKTWSDLIQASYNMGLDRMKSSSIKEIFDSESLFSILCHKDDKPFVYGVKYDASFVCATLLHYLNEIPSFFPKDEKKQALHAFGRIMMFLSLHIVAIQMNQPDSNGRDIYSDKPRYGYFSLIGKLNNSCTPNTVALYKDNKISLIALQSIKSGEEITISFQQHWLNCNEKRHERNVTHFLFNGKVCSCNICMGESPPSQKLTKSQKKLFNGLNLTGIDENIKLKHISGIYEKILEALDHLKNVPQSKEYKEVYKRFSKCKIILEYICFLNPSNMK